MEIEINENVFEIFVKYFKDQQLLFGEKITEQFDTIGSIYKHDSPYILKHKISCDGFNIIHYRTLFTCDNELENRYVIDTEP